MIITYKIAMAAGKDAANKNMIKNGRSVWNDEDYEIACKLTEQLIIG